MQETIDQRVEVASNPEFLRERQALFDCLNTERVILGVQSDYGKDLLVKVYSPLLVKIQGTDPDSIDPNNGRLVVTDPTMAELIKFSFVFI